MTIDTNILIAYLAGEDSVIEKIVEWRHNGDSLFISAITKCELLSYPRLSPSEERAILNFIQENFIIVPFDTFRAERAAVIRRAIPTMKIPDAVIASVALETNTPIITRDARGFRNIEGLEIITL